MAHFDTALNIINSAGKELGVVAADLSNPWGETDQNIVQLCSLLTRVGRMLVRARTWSHLTKEHSFATADGTADYALPSGFDRFKDATAWNRTTVWQLGGPFSPAQWQAVKARTAVGAVEKPFRIQANRLHLYPTPSAVEDIYYEYVSRFWVLETGQSAPNTDTVDTTTDVLWFDEPLLVSGLKLAWLRAKQMDTTYAQAEFDEVYRAVSGGDGAAPTFRLAGPSASGFIGDANLPDTGYGS